MRQVCLRTRPVCLRLRQVFGLHLPRKMENRHAGEKKCPEPRPSEALRNNPSQKGEANLTVVGRLAVARLMERKVHMGLRRARGILGVLHRDAPAVLKRAKLMDQGLTEYAAIFTSPNPSLTVFNNQIVITDKAQVAVGGGGKGLAAARNVEIGVLWGMMGSELLYMQSLADAANPEQAAQILRQGGVEVAGVPLHSKAILTVTQGATSGLVSLEANAAALLSTLNLRRKHFFSWEYTLDGKTFIGMPSTPEASTTQGGLTPLTIVGFRVAVTVSKSTQNAWSQVVNFLVH
jgi:hypothetical protein